MKKKVLSLVLALAICLGLTVPAFAANISDTAGINLTQGERRIYEAAENMLLDVVAGRRTSTQFTVSFPDGELGWTAGQLGLSRIDYSYAQPLMIQSVNNSLYRIHTCLDLNLPYEIFFTNYGVWHYDWNVKYTNNEVWITELICSPTVTPAYQGGSDTTVNPAKIAQAAAAAANARAIVEANEGKSNYEKLAAYRKAVSELTDYDYDALAQYYAGTYVYGDPAQMIYVFDGDPNTKVVCEGYAKAFKYLCDLSTFDGDVYCYLTAGQLNGEEHVWNVVRMEDGNYYLTDVTYYDNTGYESIPLLACANEDPANYNYQQALYTYRENQYGLYFNGFLPISATPYEPGHAVTTPTAPTPTPTPTPAPATNPFSDVKASDYFAVPVQWAVEQGITNGTGKTTFSPDKTCTQGEILTFLWRSQNEPAPIGTVTGTKFYAKAAQWAAEQGLTDTFDGEANCTRAMVVTYLWKLAGSPATGAPNFTDVASNSPYAQAVTWAVAQGITNGTSATTFSPSKACTRSEIVTFLYRAFAD